jgi:chemotaxis protein CheD
MGLKKSIIVKVSDARISTDRQSMLVTYSLGSCIAVSLFDPEIKIGGMIHYQLPDSKMNEERARRDPFMFADTGLNLLINEMTKMGANKKRLSIKAAGGAAMKTGPAGFDIGKRNFLSLRKVLWQCGIMMHGQDLGGSNPRNMYLDIETGTVLVKSNGVERKL